jgi:hypothetical protein
MNLSTIFEIKGEAQFESLALEIFRYQYQNNSVYHEFCGHLKRSEANVKDIAAIPFLPIEFFKSRTIITRGLRPEITFTSSGTTNSGFSTHCVANLTLYQQSFRTTFEQFYGPADNYCILALLPSYLERKGSSLLYMVNALIDLSQHPESGFYLDDLSALHKKLIKLDKRGTRTVLIGVSFALLDMVEKFPLTLENTIIMETGGMKGRRKELIRQELHAKLKRGFGVSEIHSEYGMTELLSQAYSKGGGRFQSPPWMKVFTRDTEDPFLFQRPGKTGGLSIIDLANVHSCSFIATQDLGRVFDNGSFEVIGRFDHSDIRGCNLMVL